MATFFMFFYVVDLMASQMATSLHEVAATILFPVFEYAGRCGI
jgi:hypothetical protein